jgi:hypothetical protein
METSKYDWPYKPTDPKDKLLMLNTGLLIIITLCELLTVGILIVR